MMKIINERFTDLVSRYVEMLDAVAYSNRVDLLHEKMIVFSILTQGEGVDENRVYNIFKKLKSEIIEVCNRKINSVSLFKGLCSIGISLHNSSNRYVDEETMDLVDLAIVKNMYLVADYVLFRDFNIDYFDCVSGLSGTIYYVARYCRDKIDNDKTISIIKMIMNSVIHQIQTSKNVAYGVAHGLVGIVRGCVEAFEMFANDKWAVSQINYLKSKVMNDSCPMGDKVYWKDRMGGRIHRRRDWCTGNVGILWMMSIVYQKMNDNKMELTMLNKLCRELSFDEEGHFDDSICHGRPGLLMLKLYYYTTKSKCRDRTRVTQEIAKELLTRKELKWEPNILGDCYSDFILSAAVLGRANVIFEHLMLDDRKDKYENCKFSI